MSILCIFVFTLIVFLNSVKTDVQKDKPFYVVPSKQNFKDYMSNIVKDQSTKIQMLLKKIQSNAQLVLKKIRRINQKTKIADANHQTNEFKRDIGEVEYQIESPVTENIKSDDESEKSSSRNFNNHYLSTGYGASGSPNYGVSTYHHHSFGFDPINIVVSMSLLSFLLQALQGFLRTRLPTPVIEARSSKDPTIWNKNIERNLKDFQKDDYLKKRIHKKFYKQIK